jgi:hypothetical protein
MAEQKQEPTLSTESTLERTAKMDHWNYFSLVKPRIKSVLLSLTWYSSETVAMKG